MNARERFLSVINFEPVDRTMLWAVGYWTDAVRRWHREGLPHSCAIPEERPGGNSIMGHIGISAPYRERSDTTGHAASPMFACAQDIHDYFGFDQGMVHVPVSHWVSPAFEEEILEDHEEWLIWRDGSGIVKRDRKDRKSLPDWIGWPVTNRDEWEQVKAERLQPSLEGRIPDDWDARIKAFEGRDYPIVIGGCPAGFYGGARHLLGQERILTTFYDDPALMHDIMDHLCDLYVGIYDQVLDQVDVDVCFIWEDMCYKNGPLISPTMFREFMLPNYKKLTACLRDHGITAIMVDTDGDARKLIPLFIEGGVTIMYSLEPQAGMDVTELREMFPNLALMGGMDKKQLSYGRQAIDAELDRKVPFMLSRGGYIPFLDHQAPPDISWANYKHYQEKLNGMIRDSAAAQV